MKRAREEGEAFLDDSYRPVSLAFKIANIIEEIIEIRL